MATLVKHNSDGSLAVSTRLAVEVLIRAWPTPLTVVRDKDDAGRPCSSVSLLNAQGQAVMNELPIWINGLPGHVLPEEICVVRFVCRACGQPGTFQKRCVCGRGEETWQTSINMLSPAEFLAHWLMQPARAGNGTLADAVFTVATRTRRKTATQARAGARDMFIRELALNAMGQLSYPEGDGARILREQGVAAGRTRVMVDDAPWLHSSIGGPLVARLHPAEVHMATLVHAAQIISKRHRLAVSATSNSKPGRVFYRRGEKWAEVLEKVYPGLRYTKPSRHNSMVSAAMNAVQLAETDELPVVMPQGGVSLPGRNLLTVWMDHPRNQADTVALVPRAMHQFWFDQTQRIRVPNGSLLLVEDKEVVYDRAELALTPQGETLRWGATEFTPGIAHTLQLRGNIRKEEDMLFADGPLTIEVQTRRVAAEGSKLTQNGNKASAVRWPEEAGCPLATFGWGQVEADVVANPERLFTGACGGSWMEAIASQIAMLEGLETLELSPDTTFAELRDRLLDVVRLTGTGDIELPDGRTLLQVWEADPTQIGKWPVSIVWDEIVEGAEEVEAPDTVEVRREELGLQLIGWNRWSLQPQHPEVVSATSKVVTEFVPILDDDESLDRVSNKSSSGAKMLGWELTTITREAPAIAAEMIKHEDAAAKAFAILMSECLVMKPKDEALKEVGYIGDFSLLNLLDDSEEE